MLQVDEPAQPRSEGVLSLSVGMAFFLPLVLAGNEIGAMLRYPELGSAVLFPPYAVLTAALVASARRHWFWYVAVAAVAHGLASASHWPLSWILLADAANVIRALTAAVLLRYVFEDPPRLDRTVALVKFLAITALIAPAIGATIGAVNPILHGAPTTYWRAWLGWFSASAVTGVILLPAFVVATAHAASWRRLRVTRTRALEAVSLAAALSLTCASAFVLRPARPGDLTLLLLAPSPILIWAAVRFGPLGASAALTVVAGAAIWGADQGIGRFTSLSRDDHVLALQLFLVVTALPVLCVATIGAARRAAIELHRAFLASLQDHVAILDARGVVLDANQSWDRFALAPHYCAIDKARKGDDFPAICRAVTQLPPEHPISNLGRAKAANMLAGAQSVLQGTSPRFELEYEQCEGGPRQWFTLRIERLERDDGGVVVTRADVSERHRAQLDVEERRREVAHLARIGVLGQLSGALAHELRQPLASILANAESAQLLLQRQPLDVAELRTVLREIVTDDRHAAKVIGGLRTMLRRGEARVAAVELEPLFGTVLAMARPELISRGVTVSATLQPALPPLLVDAVQIQQVLLNLMLNACEAMAVSPSNHRRLILTATASGERKVRISARDSGPGIPAEQLARLFEPFVTTKPDGLGLGLSISRTIVASHGGSIWAENNAEGGATVHCELPAAIVGDPGLDDPVRSAFVLGGALQPSERLEPVTTA